MELVEGITLKNYIERKGKLTVRETTSIAIQVAMGIEAAHNLNIVHRDIKPQNIIISREGKVKVTDFGIAKVASSRTISSVTMVPCTTRPRSRPAAATAMPRAIFIPSVSLCMR